LESRRNGSRIDVSLGFVLYDEDMSQVDRQTHRGNQCDSRGGHNDQNESTLA
jgi:hypothetical protein